MYDSFTRTDNELQVYGVTGMRAREMESCLQTFILTSPEDLSLMKITNFSDSSILQ